MFGKNFQEIESGLPMMGIFLWYQGSQILKGEILGLHLVKQPRQSTRQPGSLIHGGVSGRALGAYKLLNQPS